MVKRDAEQAGLSQRSSISNAASTQHLTSQTSAAYGDDPATRSDLSLRARQPLVAQSQDKGVSSNVNRGTYVQTNLEVYRQTLSADAVSFIFSEVFFDALKTKASKSLDVFGISAEPAMEEFRRLLVIKVFTVDIEATKISPTPIMDSLWHAAILDTKFYANLQTALGVTLHHNPSGAGEAQAEQRKRRLATMKAIYKSFFKTEPLIPSPLHSTNSAHRKDHPYATMEISCRTLDGVENIYKVRPTDTINDLMSAVRDKVGIPVHTQRIICGGRQLQGEKTFSDYHIQAGFRLHIVKRLAGC